MKYKVELEIEVSTANKKAITGYANSSDADCIESELGWAFSSFDSVDITNIEKLPN